MSLSLNVDALAAIDVHVHAEVSGSGGSSLPAELEQASNSYFKVSDARRPTLPEIAAYYRERRMACVVFTVDVAVGVAAGAGVGVGLGSAGTADASLLAFAFCLGPAVWRSARVAFVFARASDLVATVVLGDFRGVYPKSASVLLASSVSPNCAMTLALRNRRTGSTLACEFLSTWTTDARFAFACTEASDALMSP